MHCLAEPALTFSDASDFREHRCEIDRGKMLLVQEGCHELLQFLNEPLRPEPRIMGGELLSLI
jgi:hypothetical protein